MQKKVLRIDRTKKYPKIQFKCGANWCSITHNFAKYLLTQESLIKKMFSYTTCADEVFLQTILFSSSFENKIYGKHFGITGSEACLRSIDWTRPGTLEFSPYVYTANDYDELIASSNLICRKVTDKTPEGDCLIKKLECL